MTNEQIIVLNLLGQALFDVPFDESSFPKEEINWEKVYLEAGKQTVIPTTVGAVPKTADDKIRYQWIKDAYEYERRGYEVLKAHGTVSALLLKAGIPFVILKGASSGAYYPKSYMRNYGDVDLLISPDRLEQLKTLLTGHGFEMGKEISYEFSMSKDGVKYDIHTELGGIPNGKCGDVLRKEMENIIESAEIHNVFGREVPLTDDYRHGLIQLLHTAKHLVGLGAGLRQLCDWAVFVNRMGESFPSFFEEILKKSGLWNLALLMSTACVTYLHMTPYRWIRGADPKLVSRFMDDLTRKGGLGRDETTDDMDSLLITESDGAVFGKESMLVQMFRNISGKVCYQWPVMKKHKILIPFGFVWMCIRYVFGVLTGKYKKTNLKGTVQKAKQRRELYREIGLFSEGTENETDR